MSSINKKEKQTVEIEIGKKCDICKRISKNIEIIEKEWIQVHAMHQYWGTDSMDSSVWLDIHSPECYFKCLKKLLRKFKDYKDKTEIDGKPYDFIELLVKHEENLCQK